MRVPDWETIMSESGDEHTRPARPASAASGPNRPITGTGPRTQSTSPGKTVYLLDEMDVSGLASALKLKPFKVVADLMELKLFKSPNDMIDFETASKIARKHGFNPEKPPPGMLIL